MDMASSTPMACVAITGVSGALGRRVVALLAERADWDVIGVDIAPFPAGVAKPRRFIVHQVDLRSVDLRRVLKGADVVVHLATFDRDAGDVHRDDDAVTRKVLEAAEANGVQSLVVLSSAAVYGAHADNPVPMTEASPLRPNPGFRYASDKIDLEDAANQWRRSNPASAVAVLRPAPTMGDPDAQAWLAGAVRPSFIDRVSQPLPSMQFVHVEDVASAVVHAVEHRLDGCYNVGPADWIGGDEAPELLGPAFRFPLPVWAVDVANRLARLKPGRRPAGAMPYSRSPWVVAVDRLRATGWSPQSTSAEAFVASERPSAASRFAARHRQEVTLGIVATAAIAVVGVAGWLITRSRRRRRGGR